MGNERDAPSVGDDLRVRTVLEEELARLARVDPYAALGLAAGAPPHEVRARFLELTRRFHPTRFARRPPAIARLANEVFLRLKSAYEAASEGGAEAQAARRVTQKSERLDRLSPVSQPKLEVDAALARRRRMRSYPVLPATGGTEPVSRPGSQPVTRPVTQPVTQPVTTLRPEEIVEKVKRREEERKERLSAAVGDLRAGRLDRARELLRALLAETPTDKQVRVLLHYTVGREHHAAGRVESARAEYERALAIDPAFEPAQKSLALLGEPPEEDRGGLISRWFRR